MKTFWIISAVFLHVFVFNITWVESATTINKCTNDADCFRGEFCKFKRGYQFCTVCVQCSDRFQRLPPRDGSCARTPNECGNCNRGYDEQMFAGGRRSNHCIPRPLPTKAALESEAGAGEWKLGSIVFFVIGVVVLVGGLLMMGASSAMTWLQKRRQQQQTGSNSIRRDLGVRYTPPHTPPPSYRSVTNPNSNSSIVGDTISGAITFTSSSETKNDAEVFRRPNYEAGMRADLEIEVRQEVVTETVDDELAAFFTNNSDDDVLNDSTSSVDTVPSQWTPTPSTATFSIGDYMRRLSRSNSRDSSCSQGRCVQPETPPATPENAIEEEEEVVTNADDSRRRRREDSGSEREEDTSSKRPRME